MVRDGLLGVMIPGFLLLAVAAGVAGVAWVNSDRPAAISQSRSDGPLTHAFVEWPIHETFEPPAEGYPLAATWESPVLEAEAPFVEALPSWNATLPDDAGVRAAGRVRIDGEWSPWLDFGGFGHIPAGEEPTRFEHGRVAVDVLQLNRPADAFQLRLTSFNFDVNGTLPTLRRAAVALSSPADEPPADEPTGEEVIVDVPFLAQRDAGDRVGGSICSPTSVTTVLNYHGESLAPLDAATVIYDREHGLFGNWNRATAFAGSLGYDATLRRFSGINELRPYFEAGLPVIASINFDDGECPSFVMDSTNGHLIVLRGLTAEGDVVVNDPASAEHGDGPVYQRDELRRAWLENAGGVAYVIRPEAS